jgi:PKD repeat protein
MMYRNVLYVLALILVFFQPCFIFGQDQQLYPELGKQFTSYQIIQADAASISSQLRASQRGGRTTLKINEGTAWHMNLENSNLISEDYMVTVATENGLVRTIGCTALPMKGSVEGHPGSEVSLTFNNDFIYGYIRLGMQMYYIEPLYHFVKNADKGSFVVYSVRDIIPGTEKKCGYDNFSREMQRHRSLPVKDSGSRMPGACFVVDINIASDYSMVQNYGLTGTQNHNVGVLNNVQTNYDNEFPDALQFSLGEQWISNCSTCDPWTSSLDPGDLLNDFTSWALNGFSVAHDVASCWSRRDFLGGTIGLAWVGTVCTQYKYHVLQDFSSNAELKRVLVAHEMGHNFDASHNTGIMAPSVSTATNWSSTSVAEISAYYNSVNCLSNCTSGTAPSPDFTYVLIDPCTPATVEYTALAPNANTWEWTFNGGTPAFSTLQNPVVQYATGGVHNVTLEVSNGYGSNSSTIPVYVNSIPNAVANFQYTINNHVVSFTFTGTAANTYSWDFGDGTPLVTIANPVHTFPLNGTYDVTLEVGNACGTNSITKTITISVLPFVNFSAVPISGCQPLTVAFTNLSTNAVTYNWSFPGGTPSNSTAANPVVVYNTGGFHSVTLEATNSTGTNVLIKNDYITVDPLPSGGFTTSISGPVVTFTNQALAADSITWHFGDGQTSQLLNPVHTYTTNDTFIVIQVLKNGCGTVQYSQQVIIASPPQAAFLPANRDTLCVSQSVQFASISTNNPVTYSWTFEGGSPAFATDSMAEVTYNTPGVYDVTLVVTNSFGTSQTTQFDHVVVNSVPSVSYSFAQTGLQLDFASVITNGSNIQWQFGDGSTSGEPNPMHIFGGESTYSVTLTAGNTCGDSTYVQQVPVYLFPQAGMQLSEDSVCIAGNIQFTGTSSSSSNQWYWQFAGGQPATSSVQNPVVNYPASGQYVATLIVANAAGSDTIQQQVEVLPGSQANMDFTQAGFMIACQFTGALQDSLRWDFGDGNSSAQVNPTHTYSGPGTYTIVLITYNECGNDTVSRQVTILPSSNGELLIQETIRLVPNPTSGQFVVETSSPSDVVADIVVRDLMGREVVLLKSATLKAGSPVFLDISSVQDGMYLVTLRNGNDSRTWILLKTE